MVSVSREDASSASMGRQAKGKFATPGATASIGAAC
jgi:hypothetical protein